MKKFIFITVLGFSCLTSCSRLDLAFNWVDTYIASEVDDYFDLSFKQNKQLKKSIQNDLEKVKKQILPELIQDVQTAKKYILKDELNQTKIAEVFSSTLKKMDYIKTIFSTTAVEFISNLSPRQFDYFNNTYLKKRDEEREMAVPEKKSKDLRKKYIKYFEMFLGDLNQEQYKLIDSHIRTNPFPSELKNKNKEWVFEEFTKQKNSLNELQNFIRTLLNEPQKYQLPEYQKALSSYYQNLQILLVDFSRTLTKKQKEELVSVLDEKTAQLENIKARD